MRLCSTCSYAWVCRVHDQPLHPGARPGARLKVLGILAGQAWALGAQELQAWGATAGKLYSVGLDLARALLSRCPSRTRAWRRPRCCGGRACA